MSVPAYPVAFYFKVVFKDKTGSQPVEVECKEVSGLRLEREMETVHEGGINTFAHQLPKHVTHGNLVLKRAGLPLPNNLQAWITACMEGLNYPLKLQDVSVSLLNAEGQCLRQWTCTGAYPVKWEASDLDAEKNGLMIETLELAYQELKTS